MTLLATMVFAYLAAPPARAGYALMQVGAFRGIYDSWYIGTLLAVMTGSWLTIAGFYVVKNTVSRDETTGVGQILAATPLRSSTYLFGKFQSNFLVLATMTGVIAVMALVMLWVRDEASSVDLVALWLPFLLFPSSIITLVAGAAGARAPSRRPTCCCGWWCSPVSARSTSWARCARAASRPARRP
jgi:hypothetical protein